MSSIQSTNASGALASVRVVELGSMVAAPICGQILADLGADVIKVEPLGGEVMRVIPPVYKGVSAAFSQWNRNKRSIALDLKAAEGMEILRKLIGSSEVFLQNLRAGSAGKMGLGYDKLAAGHPDLIYVEMTGYGSDGPYKDQPGLDMLVQALTGFMPIQGSKEKPMAVRGVVADKIAGYSAALSILAAIVHRRTGGSGQRIDTSILDSYAAFMLPDHFYTSTFLQAPPEAPFTADIFNIIELKDGLAMGYVMTEGHFQTVCDTFNLDEARTDPRFANPGARNVNQPALISLIARACDGMSVGELVAIARERRLPFAPINDLKQFANDAQAQFNETFVQFEDPQVGTVRLLNGFSKLSKTPINARSLAPSLGADTDVLLAEIGLSRKEIADLRARKIVG